MLRLNEEYQVGVVEAGASCLRDLTSNHDVSGTLVLTAPTGAGKTVMIAAMLAEAARDAYVLWTTPGKGNLEEQSYWALTSHLIGTPLTVERLTPEYLAQSGPGEPGTIVVTNWEELVQTNRDGGEPTYKNRLTIGSESGPGLLEHLMLTGKSGVPVIVVIDESHYGKGESSKQVSAITTYLAAIDSALGYPAVRLEASATPIFTETTQRMDRPTRSERIEVTLEQVIQAGMVKKEVRVNSGIRDNLEAMTDEQRASQTGERLVLSGAWERIELLREQYRSLNSPVKPLLLVQLPNKRGNDERDRKIRETVSEFFRDLGITEDNGRLAVLLSGETRDPAAMAKIASNDSPIEVLIFKQGITLGWDCPRAQVLLAFRDMASEIFKIQTIGRILRMPERKHYNDPAAPDLDDAFVYSNIEFTLYKQVPGAPPVVSTELRKKHDVCRIPIRYTSRSGGYNDLLKSVMLEVFAEDEEANALPGMLRTKKSVADMARGKTTVDLVSDQVVSIGEIYDGDVSNDEDSTVTVGLSHGQLESKYEDYLLSVIPFTGKVRSLSVLKDFVYGWLRPAFASDLDSEARILGTQRVLLSPRVGASVREALERMLRKAHEVSNSMQKVVVEKAEMWTGHEIIEWPDEGVIRLDAGDVLSPTCLYQDAKDRGCIPESELSEPEQAFLEELRQWHRRGLVKTWWKSSQGDRRFPSITYEANSGEKKTTYPDFFAWLVDGRLAVLETKGAGMENGIDPEARRKAVALKDFASWAQDEYGKKPAFDDPVSVVSGVIYKGPTCWMLAGESAEDDIPLDGFLFP